jgi:hypothetical protein
MVHKNVNIKLDAIKLKMQRLGMLKEKVEALASNEVPRTYEEPRAKLGLDRHTDIREAMREFFTNLARRRKEERAKKEESERVTLTMQSG